MQLPVTTGLAAQILGVTEPQLNGLVRRHRIHPTPTVILGRRLWHLNHIRAAARCLNLDDGELQRVMAAFDAPSAGATVPEGGRE